MLRSEVDGSAEGLEQHAIGRCLVCEVVLPNPCAIGKEWRVSELSTGHELVISDGNIIRCKTAEELLLHGVFCRIGRWLGGKYLARGEHRDLVSYILLGGLERGMRYEWPDGTEYIITPDLVDAVFDRRMTPSLPVTRDWNDEPQAYDRSISEWLQRACEGRISKRPDKRWTERLRLLDLTMRVLNSTTFNDR